MMREDMEAMGPVRLKEVDEAQANVVRRQNNWPIPARS